MIQITDIVIVFLISSKFFQYCHRIVELEGDEGGFALSPQAQTVVPVCVQSCRHAVRTEMVKGKLYGAFQMLVDSSFIFIGKWDDLVKECGISGFGDVFIDRREQPECIVRAVCRVSGLLYIGCIVRGILMSGIMGELHERKSASVVHLC